MINPKLLDEIAAKFAEVMASSPAKDLEKNARALLTSAFSRLDLVTRQEYDVQQEILARTREKLGHLERRLAELEARLAGGGSEDKG